jgi:hypothetical protein
MKHEQRVRIAEEAEKIFLNFDIRSQDEENEEERKENNESDSHGSLEDPQGRQIPIL